MAILMSGVLVSLGYSYSTGSSPAAVFDPLINLASRNGVDIKTLIAILGIAIASLLAIRTISTLFTSYKSYQFLAIVSGRQAASLVKGIYGSGFSWIRRKNIQEVSFVATQGVENIFIGALGQYMIYISDLVFVVIVAIALFIVNPLLMAISVSTFLLLGTLSYLYSSKRVAIYSKLLSENTILGNIKVSKLVKLFREVTVSGNSEALISDFSEFRNRSSLNFAKLNWIQIVPKFSVEIVIVLGTFAVTVTSALTLGFSSAMSTMTIFLTATSRVAPAALRIQQALTQINSYLTQSALVLEYTREIKDIGSHYGVDLEDQSKNIVNLQPPSILVSKLSYTYLGAQANVLNSVDLAIGSGESVAIVGESGAGKTTLCDLMLGILKPTSGEILIDGLSPRDFQLRNPLKVAYLSQEPYLFHGTIRENIVLDPGQQHDDVQIWEALKKSKIADFVAGLPGRLDYFIQGESKVFSGGQAQRISIARALFHEPILVFLDEPTSSLDPETENDFLETLDSLKGKATIVTIAHKPETIHRMNKVVKLSNGRINAE
jgi:ABC-type bacteriocin/lantibiotic exporter with double-glycine peptidase domain